MLVANLFLATTGWCEKHTRKHLLYTKLEFFFLWPITVSKLITLFLSICKHLERQGMIYHFFSFSFLTTSTVGIAPHLILLIYSIGNQITKMFTSVGEEIVFFFFCQSQYQNLSYYQPYLWKTKVAFGWSEVQCFWDGFGWLNSILWEKIS